MQPPKINSPIPKSKKDSPKHIFALNNQARQAINSLRKTISPFSPKSQNSHKPKYRILLEKTDPKPKYKFEQKSLSKSSHEKKEFKDDFPDEFKLDFEEKIQTKTVHDKPKTKKNEKNTTEKTKSVPEKPKTNDYEKTSATEAIKDLISTLKVDLEEYSTSDFDSGFDEFFPTQNEREIIPNDVIYSTTPLKIPKKSTPSILPPLQLNLDHSFYDLLSDDDY